MPTAIGSNPKALNEAVRKAVALVGISAGAIQVLDAFTTVVGLRLGLYEAVPFTKLLMDIGGIWLVILVKAVFALGFSYGGLMVSENLGRLGRYAPIIGTPALVITIPAVIWAAEPVVNNFILIMGHLFW